MSVVSEDPARTHSGVGTANVRRVAIFVALGVVAWRVLAGVLHGPDHVFSEHRLMPVILFLKGLPVYPSPANGPFYVPMYPPLSFLLYLPVGLVPDPVAALRIGSALAALSVFVPCALLVREAARPRRDTLVFSLGLLVAVAGVHLSPILRAALFVHADAPALLFAGTGVVLLHRALTSGRSRVLAAAVLACSLAPWAKQTFVPVAALPVLVLLFRRNLRGALVTLLGTGALQMLLLLSAGATFGFRGLVFWTLDFPSRHPWSGPALETLSWANSILLVECLPLLGVGLVVALARQDPLAGPAPWTQSLSGLLLAAGIVLWPTSVLGCVKVGGALNALIPTLFFLSLSCLVALISASRAETGRRFRPAHVALGTLAAVAGLQCVVDAALLTKALPGRTWDAEVVARTVRADRGFYFPWYPLSSYLASGEFVHCDLGISDRKLAGIEIPPSKIMEFVPRDVTIVVCGSVPCPTTLASFEVVRTTTESASGKEWTFFRVRRPPAR